VLRRSEFGAERKGGRSGDGAPFIGDAAGVGDGQRAVPHGGEVWGCVGPARAACDRHQNRGGRELTGGPCYSPGRWWFEYISNSNEFKLLQNISNFDRSKNDLR
jgi:hypothetical protein